MNIIAVAFKVLPLGSYVLMSAPSLPLKTILELVLWNGLQSCRRITANVINFIKMPSFLNCLNFREQKEIHWGLDPVNIEVVPTQVFVPALSETVRYEQVNCRDSRSMSCW
jgi:hypothetical protein